MEKGSLTRQQAVARVGEAAVLRAESEGCEPTGRVGYNGAMHGDDLTEWRASAQAVDEEGIECSVYVYYYTDNDRDERMGQGDADIEWEIAGYEVE